MPTNRNFTMDNLESRQMLADVAASFSGGLLNIVGSASADEIRVSVSGNNLLLRPGAGTTINGGTSGLTLPKFSVTSISAALGEGNDSISLSGVDQGLGGTLNTGGGADSVSLFNTRLAGMLLQTGTGIDIVTVLSSTLQSVIVDTGSGNDLVSVLDNTVFNYSSINLGAGNDVFAMVKNTVFGFTSVDGGAGTDIAIGLFNNLPGGTFLTGIEYRLGI